MTFLLLVTLAGTALSYGLASHFSTTDDSYRFPEAESDLTQITQPTSQLSSTAQTVASMTLEEKIGQMMMVGFDGSEPDSLISEAIQERHAGGVILFARNIVDHEQVASMDADLQQLAVDAGQPARLLIAVDQEGSKTRRFKDIGPQDSEPMIGDMAEQDAAAASQYEAELAAKDLKALGINTNLAPVVDVSAGEGTVMDTRSYGTDPMKVAKLSAASITGYVNSKLICSPKHFPGLGSADGDSEKVLPTVSTDAASLENTDLLPFKEAIRERAPMIMVAHLLVPAVSSGGQPSSMSPAVITGLLRGTMKFTGVVITDDMEMGAVSAQYEIAEAAVGAVEAGADIILVAQTAAAQKEAYDALLEGASSGKISQAQIDAAVVRILDMKKQYGLSIN